MSAHRQWQREDWRMSDSEVFFHLEEDREVQKLPGEAGFAT